MNEDPVAWSSKSRHPFNCRAPTLCLTRQSQIGNSIKLLSRCSMLNWAKDHESRKGSASGTDPIY
jgi:hypothetical protein